MTHFDMKSSPFYFCRKLSEWNDTPRIAAINSFADGGTNAHVILEALEDSTSSQIKRNPILPPELNRYDVFHSHASAGACRKAVYDKSNQRVQKLSNTEINVWKQKIEG